MESSIREKARPYFYEAGSESVAVLVHGFTGSPDDMRELAKFLASKNVSASVPLLAGHGSHWTHLENTSYYDWWKSVEDEVKKLSEKYKKIFLIGNSFGGNLSLDIAARYPDLVKGVITLGISVFLRKEILIRTALPIFHFFFKQYRKAYIKKDHLFDYEESGCYVQVPTKSVYDFYYFIKNYTKKELHKVKAPSLIIHSKDDAVTHPLSSQFVYERIGSEKKELMMLDDVNHNPIVSRRKDTIFNKIDEFIKTVY